MQRNQEILGAPAAHLSSKLCQASCCCWCCFPAPSGNKEISFSRCFSLTSCDNGAWRMIFPPPWRPGLVHTRAFCSHHTEQRGCGTEGTQLAQKQTDESPGSSAHPHPKTQMNKANIGSWKETDTGISLEQILGRKGWGGAVTLVQPKALGWIKQIFLVFKKFSNPHLAQGLSFKEITLNFHFVQVTEMGVLPTSPLRSQLYFIDKFNPQEVKWGFSKGAESFAHSTEGILVSMGWSAWALHWLHPRAVLCSRPLELPAPALGAAAHLWDHSPKRAASTGAC